MSRIFISYRRDDSADASGRLYDRLVAEFGKESVFKDVDNIPLGMDFRGVLREVVGRCEVMLVVIGRQWVGATDEHGRRRLENPADFVRIEVEAALERDIPVIPVLVQNAAMPSELDLPPSLAPLAYRNGIAVRADPHFHGDATLLISRTAPLLKPTNNPPSSLPESSDNADGLLAKGRTLANQYKGAEALPFLERAVQADPRNIEAWQLISVVLADLKRYQEALEALDRGLALDPNHAGFWNAKAVLLVELKRPLDALAAAERATVLSPKWPGAWIRLGDVLDGLKRHVEAVEAYDRALALFPDDAEVWEKKAVALRALGRMVEADEALQRAWAMSE